MALNKDLYIWNAVSKEISQLFAMDENDDAYITSVSWLQRGDVLAVGTSRNQVELWDVAKSSAVRVMSSHRARIGSLAWNAHLLASGARSGHVHMHDVREKEHHVNTLYGHKQEVCGLKWSNDGRFESFFIRFSIPIFNKNHLFLNHPLLLLILNSLIFNRIV